MHGVIVSELARHTEAAKSHVSNVIDQLVERDCVEKRPDPGDQRLQRLYVTRAAQRALSGPRLAPVLHGTASSSVCRRRNGMS